MPLWSSSGVDLEANVKMSEVALKYTNAGIEVHCPKCDALMRKLHWIYPSQYKPERIVFSGWFGCTDCGKTVYDKSNDAILEAIT